MTATNKFFLSLSCFFLFSCKSAMDITPGSERVRVLDAEPRGCLYVGEVSSVQEERGVGTLETEMDLATRVDLRNKAHALGANILVFLKGKNTNTLPGSVVAPMAIKSGDLKSKASKTITEKPVEVETTKNENGEVVSTIVFLGTVFKCPSSILNQ